MFSKRIEEYRFKNFRVVVMMFPSLSLSDASFNSMHEDVLFINKSSNLNLNYGVYAKQRTTEELKEIYSKMFVLIIYKDNKPVGSSFGHFLGMINDTPCIHSGLTIISHNPGINILSLMESFKIKFLQDTYGHYYVTGITTIPKIVTSFCLAYSKAWPAPNSNLMFAPKVYKEVVGLLENNYIRVHFPNPESIEVDKRRFILHTNKREAGFKENFHLLSKSNKLMDNLFCQCWIDYENNEDLILVAYSGLKSRIISNVILVYLSLTWKLRKYNFNISSIFIKKNNA